MCHGFFVSRVRLRRYAVFKFAAAAANEQPPSCTGYFSPSTVGQAVTYQLHYQSIASSNLLSQFREVLGMKKVGQQSSS